MLFSFIVPFALLLVLVASILLAVAIKQDLKEGGEEVIKTVYVYLVLFATLMMTIGGSVGVFMALADIVAPAPYHQSFEDFKRWGGEKPEPNAAVEKLSEEEQKARYKAMVTEQKEAQIGRAQNTLVKSLGWIVVPLPVFIYFQRRLNRKEA